MTTTAAPVAHSLPTPLACAAVATLLHSDIGCLNSAGPAENLAFFIEDFQLYIMNVQSFSNVRYVEIILHYF